MQTLIASLTGVVLGMLTPSTPYFDRKTFSESARSLRERFDRAMEAGEMALVCPITDDPDLRDG